MTSKHYDVLDPLDMRGHTGYMPLEQYGLIGNLETTALVAVDGGLDFMCWPNHDSPSVFCRLLDKDKGGYFTISPAPHQGNVITKQQYLPSSNILQTMHLHDDGVMKLIDFFPRPDESVPVPGAGDTKAGEEMDTDPGKTFKKWLVRRVECVRGEVCFVVRVLPAFNYARDSHIVKITSHKDGDDVVLFASKDLKLELHVVVDSNQKVKPTLKFEVVIGHALGFGAQAYIRLQEGQRCSFILRQPPGPADIQDRLTNALVDGVQKETKDFWFRWISQSRFKGRWHEVVQRSLLTLKMLTFEPTGAIIAAPTFSLPESIGGSRNWDYRFSYVYFLHHAGLQRLM
jgi:GH15 family glucan-1,4-alpha-glucosidase